MRNLLASLLPFAAAALMLAALSIILRVGPMK